MAKQDVLPASKSVTGRTVWDFATHIATTLGPLILLVTGAVYAVFKFQEQSHHNQIALATQNTAAMSAQAVAVSNTQAMLTKAHEATQKSYESTGVMNASMIKVIKEALAALELVQKQSNQKVTDANAEIQGMRNELGQQLADQKERAETELKRIEAEAAAANEVKERANEEAEAARRRQIIAEQDLAKLQRAFEVTKEAVDEAQKVRIEKKARLKEDVGQLIKLVEKLAVNSPPAPEAPLAAVVKKAADIRVHHLIDPAALLAAFGESPTRETMVQLADLESVPSEQIRRAINDGIPGFDAWYYRAEDDSFLGVRRADDYSLRQLTIKVYDGRVLSVDVDDYVELTMCTIPSPANWDDSLKMYITNALWRDDVDAEIWDEPSDELVNLPEDGIWSFESRDKSVELINGHTITVKVSNLPTLWRTKPTTARALFQSSEIFARAEAMWQNAALFNGRKLVPVRFFEDNEDRETLREDTVRILNAAVNEKSDRADLGTSNLDPKAWGRLATVALSRGSRLERFTAGSNEVSVELRYLDEWGDPVGAFVRLHRLEQTQTPTWQLAELTTDIPRSKMTIQPAMPKQQGAKVPIPVAKGER